MINAQFFTPVDTKPAPTGPSSLWLVTPMAIPSGLPWMTYGRINSKNRSPWNMLGKNQDNQTAVSMLWFLQYKICIYNYIYFLHMWAYAISNSKHNSTITNDEVHYFRVHLYSTTIPRAHKRRTVCLQRKLNGLLVLGRLVGGFNPVLKDLSNWIISPRDRGSTTKNVSNLQLQNGPLLVVKWPIVKLKSQYISKEGTFPPIIMVFSVGKISLKYGFGNDPIADTPIFHGVMRSEG